MVKNNTKYIDENGVSYRRKICAKEPEKKYERFKERIRRNGFTPKEAFDTLNLKLKEARKILKKPSPFVKDIIPQNGLTMDGIYRRLCIGMSLKEALEKPRMKGGGVIKYEIDGVSVKELLATRREYERFIRLIHKGCSLKEAFKRCKTSSLKKLPEEMKKLKGKDWDRVYWRLRKGWSLEDALNTPVLTKKECMKRASAKSPWIKRKKEK